MAERKVLLKYYPPDYDPSKVPRLRLPANRQLASRIMLPMSVQCLRCGEFIYKGKKFNARKEWCVGEDYLGIKRFRFYFRCPSCLNEITFKTDPQHSGYEVEMGASRNYEPWKERKDDEERQRRQREQEDDDVMKRLENKSKDGLRDMEMAEIIDELRERNSKQQRLSTDTLLDMHVHSKQRQEQDEDEKAAKEAFNRRLHDTTRQQPAPAADDSKRARMTVEALDFELQDDDGGADGTAADGETAERKDAEVTTKQVGGAASAGSVEETEAEDEFGKEKRALSAGGLSFAALVSEGVAGTAGSEERKEASALQSLHVVVKKRKTQSAESAAKKQKAPLVPPPAAAAPAALSSLLGGYDASDSD